VGDIQDLFTGLYEAGAELTGQEAADALWLAAHMADGPAYQDQEPWPPGADPTSGEWTVAAAHGEHGPPPDPHLARPPLRVPISPTGRVRRLAPGPRPRRERELPQQLALQRGLRVLARTIRTGPMVVLDEETTATHSAEAGTVIPVLTRSSRRWLSLALVVDTSPSMVLWDGIVAELHTLLGQLGAFHAIRIWDLMFRDGKAAIRPRGSGGTPRSPRELAGPARRQAILVLTDCTGEAWRAGAAMQTLHGWARTGPLAIAQPLPQRLWPRSALACQYVRIRAPFPGAPNHRLTADPADGPLADADRTGVPVPVLEISPSWLGSWARMVSGPGRTYAMAAFTGAAPAGSGDAATATAEHSEQVVGRFMTGASAGAFRLAGLLSAAPLSLSVAEMRHIQQAMTGRTRSQYLAEVYLGGLLRSVRPPESRSGTEPEFDFRPGVRDVLLGTIRRSEAVQVAELASAELSRPGPPAGQVPVLEAAGDSAGAAVPGTEDGSRQQAESLVLRRIGRRYARAADLPAPDAPAPALDDPLVPIPAADAPTAAFDDTPVPIPAEDADPPAAPPAIQFPAPARSRRGDAGPGSRAVERLGNVGIAMWGAPRSGKTTFLAALDIALTRQSSPWTVTGADESSVNILVDLTTDLAQRRFPRVTAAMDQCQWTLERQPDARPAGRWRRRRAEGPTAVGLDLIDASGELFSAFSGRYPEGRGDLITSLQESRGIVFIFDPVRENQLGDAYEHTIGLLAELALRMAESDALVDGRLPHYVAVCVAKFDQVKVLATANALGLLTVDPLDRFGFPRVAEDDAEELFAALSEVSHSGTADLMMNTLRQHFLHRRLKVFVTSSIGFYVDQRTGIFDPEDYQNEVPDETEPGGTRVRGAVHPINVAEPMIWLARQLSG
jgi:hypothetical protein